MTGQCRLLSFLLSILLPLLLLLSLHACLQVRQAVADRREVAYEEEARALQQLLFDTECVGPHAAGTHWPDRSFDADLLAVFGLTAPGGAALRVPGAAVTPPAGSNSDGACYLFRIDDEWIVDATTTGGPARFINHCCA